MPGAPVWIRPLAATTLAEGGDRQGARTMLNELRGSEERYVRVAAERGLLQLDALDQIDELNRRTAEFYARTHAYPANLVELMRAYGVNGLPSDPTGAPYAYDPATHVASLSPQSALNPLPTTLAKK
jgi:HEAT repeat protein